ncbi:hypothetical protein C8Q80DRAFT_1270638 [Daedaleopsis nitida]|nr:hypothetical protein C8Q80DRAFT_1270638 [Daedaleopsis nitida]
MSSSADSGASGGSDMEAAEQSEYAVAYLGPVALAQYVMVAATMLLFYEYCITLKREIHYAWGRKLTWPRLVFFANRYTVLVQQLVAVTSVFLAPSFLRQVIVKHSLVTDGGCVILQRFVQACTVILYVIWAVFSGIRVYTFSGHLKVPAGLVTMLGLIPVVMTILLSEAGVIVVTIVHTWLRCRKEQLKPQCIANLILREGVLYFVAMLVANILQIVSDVYMDTEAGLFLAAVAVYLNL